MVIKRKQKLKKADQPVSSQEEASSCPQSFKKRPEDKEVSSKKDKQAQASRGFGRQIVAGVLVALFIMLILIGAAFSWNRWFRYDDTADFQGEWQAHETTTVVVIDSKTVKLTEDVSYAYVLDTGAKTISFSFGDLQGQGRYYFSPDRSQLIIEDGEDYTWLSTLIEDIERSAVQSKNALFDQPQEEVVSGKGVTVFDLVSHDSKAKPHKAKSVKKESSADKENSSKEASSGKTKDSNKAADSQSDKDKKSSGKKNADSSKNKTKKDSSKKSDDKKEKKDPSSEGYTLPSKTFVVNDRAA